MEDLTNQTPRTTQEIISDEITKVLQNNQELAPLRPVMEGVVVGEPGEARFAFASLLKSFRDAKDSEFEKKFEDEVPLNLRSILEQYGQMPDMPEGSGHEAEDVDKFESGIFKNILSDLGLHWSDDGEEEPIVEGPLPSSSMFNTIARELLNKAKDFPNVLESDGKQMRYVPSLAFQNWGLTVANTPAYTFIARTEGGLRNLVKWAGRQKPKLKVRVAGYRHTWTDFYSNDGQILVMLLPLEYLADLAKTSPSLQEIRTTSDLVGIEITGSEPEHALCTVKAGTTSEMFREWCLKERLWCLPFHVVMVEITFGGSNGSICHGAGFGTKTTLSDLVQAFYYIDSNGESQCITDQQQLRAASGCFGLLGICTAVTLRLDKMTMATMNPVRRPLPLAIPPPPGFDLPLDVRTQMEKFSPQQLKDAEKDFIRRCEEDDYLEWFWFPLTGEVWVNTWKKENVDQRQLDALEPYPSAWAARRQWLEGWLAQHLGPLLAPVFTPKVQTSGLAHYALVQMPDIPKPEDAIKTLHSEAIHFRRGVQNMRCRSSEWEIPIPAVQGDPEKRNYKVIQQAWWDGIKAFFDHVEDAPIRIALEMRLTGDSDVILAPQRHNKFGTISIEPVTTMETPPEHWKPFLQDLVNRWAQYKDAEGKPLNIRPHWAKEWQGLIINNQAIEVYLKETAYKEAIPEFVAVLREIVEAQGTTLEDMRAMFGNELLENLFFKP